MVFVVVSDEALGLVLVDDVAVKHSAVPVAHLARLTGLEDDVGKFWTRGHGGSSHLPAPHTLGAQLWRRTQANSDM